MNLNKENVIRSLLQAILVSQFSLTFTSVACADVCPPGTTQVGTREERINDTTVVVHPQCKRNAKIAAGWMSGLDCAMADVYGRAESFGPEGLKFAADLRAEMKKFQTSAATSTPGAGGNDVDVTSLDLNRQMAVAGSAGTSESQFVVAVLVVRHAQGQGQGQVSVDVQSYLGGTDHSKTDQRQNIMIFDAAGNLAKETDAHGETAELAQVSDSVKRCMAR